jgi:hypothetical protein
MAVVTPISRPAESRSGPPELPGLIAASVWITPRIGRCVTDSISRFNALMMPVVSVWSSPKGLPMAKTFCPTCRSLLDPRAMGFNFSVGASMRSTAISRSGKTPTRVAFHTL